MPFKASGFVHSFWFWPVIPRPPAWRLISSSDADFLAIWQPTAQIPVIDTELIRRPEP
jgi:hypothetical protein